MGIEEFIFQIIFVRELPASSGVFDIL